MAQSLIVAIVVAASAAYAVWALMPAAWRRSLARRLGWAEPAAACGGCDSCGPAPSPDGAPREAVITLHRRRG